MCFLPYMTPIQQTTMAIDAFGGYDHNLRIADGSLYDMKNLTSDNFPVLTPRNRRGEHYDPKQEYRPYNVIGAESTRCFVRPDGNGGAQVVIDDTLIKDLGLNDTEKTIIRNGAYLLIFPDKKYINTVKRDEQGNFVEYGDIEVGYAGKAPEGESHLLLYRVYDDRGRRCRTISRKGIIDNPEDGCVAFTLNSTDHSIKRWNAKTEAWEDVGKLYLRIFGTILSPGKAEYEEFLGKVEEGDCLTIDAFAQGTATASKTIFDERVYATVEEVTIESEDGNADEGETYKMFCITDADAMYELLSVWWAFALTDTDANGYVGCVVAELDIQRPVPVMDFVLECNNRIWGCRCGNSREGEYVNEIYAAQQGNFKNWYMFAGISTDSYVASCGASGVFTGAINFNGRPLFFKENHYYLVSGDYPSEYGYSEGPIKGVQNGSGKSLVVIDRVAYYKGVDGVYAFDGYSATCISAALGDVYYTNARAGAYRNKYYITMQDDNGVWHLFVYDTKKGLWHKEDNQQVDFFFNQGLVLYFVSNKGGMQSVDGESLPQMERLDLEGIDLEKVEWMAETGNLTTGIPYKKYLAKLNVRMKVHQGASVRIFIQYDESGKWEELFYMTATKQRSFTIPIRPKRCDHIKLKLTGVGDVEIYSIIKTLEKGSDL